MDRAGIARRRSRGQLARSLNRPGDGVAPIVDQHAGGFEQDFGVEPSIVQELGGDAGARRHGREQVSRRDALAAALGEIFGEPPDGGQLRFTRCGHPTTARTEPPVGPK